MSTEKWAAPAEGRENDAWRVVLVALVLVGIIAALVMGALGALGGPAAEVEEDTSKDGQGPAVTPAEVHTLPSRTKIGLGSTSTAGKFSARALQAAQCVVARRPFDSPDVQRIARGRPPPQQPRAPPR